LNPSRGRSRNYEYLKWTLESCSQNWPEGVGRLANL
jgi:hypothetical protein